MLEKCLCRIVTTNEIQFVSMLEEGTIGNVFILSRLQEQYYAKGKNLFMCIWTCLTVPGRERDQCLKFGSITK